MCLLHKCLVHLTFPNFLESPNRSYRVSTRIGKKSRFNDDPCGGTFGVGSYLFRICKKRNYYSNYWNSHMDCRFVAYSHTFQLVNRNCLLDLANMGCV